MNLNLVNIDSFKESILIKNILELIIRFKNKTNKVLKNNETHKTNKKSIFEALSINITKENMQAKKGLISESQWLTAQYLHKLDITAPADPLHNFRRYKG